MTNTRTYFHDGDTIDGYTLPDGWSLRVSIEHDASYGAPWKEHEGHGEVSEWTRRDKRPGEWVLNDDRGSSRFYDAQESQRIALRDGWGMAPEWVAEFTTKHGRAPTRREIAAAAVRADFDHLRRWCADEWFWCVVSVSLRDDEGTCIDHDCIGGVESDADEHIAEMVRDMAVTIMDRRADEIAEAFDTIAADTGADY